jgi:hypothetical protein
VTGLPFEVELYLDLLSLPAGWKEVSHGEYRTAFDVDRLQTSATRKIVMQESSREIEAYDSGASGHTIG